MTAQTPATDHTPAQDPLAAAGAPFTPELGQVLYGIPTQEYDAPEYVIALLIAALEEYARVYWNVNQESCDIFGGSFTSDDDLGRKLAIDGLAVRSYWWGNEDDPRAHLPNFAYAGVAVSWYKHVGRGTAVNVDWEPAAWVAWFDSVVAAIRAADGRHY